MPNEHRPNQGSGQPDIYQIILQGHLSGKWSDWFDGFTITLDELGRTILVGPVVDQAALHGVLKKIRDLGITLISVNRLDPGEEATNQTVVPSTNPPLKAHQRLIISLGAKMIQWGTLLQERNLYQGHARNGS